MPLSRTRDYLSIGEVLETIRPDFPDVSISKIRFLEAEGLISPERTGSGYRKFYEPDVARLRYILSLQRDHFLPLKVIRERLVEFESNGGQAPAEPAAPPKQSKGVRTETPAPSAALSDVSLSRAELKSTARLSEEELVGLEDFGLVAKGKERYDGDDLTVAKAAKGLFEFGVEPRHLRMFRQLAEREASFVEQIVAPVALKKDRNAQQEASRSTQTLVGLSRSLREALLRSSLKDLL